MKSRYLSLILLFVLPSSLFSQSTGSFAPVNEEHIRQIEGTYARFDREDGPGIAIGIIQQGQLVYEKSLGMANLDYNIPITSQSAFNVASVSKQFTAATLALLILDGKVSLEDPVKKHIKEFPDYPGPIRVKHLVYMTSGLKEYYTLDRPGGRDWWSDYFTVEDAIAVVLSQDSLDFEPGTTWAYSNINYMLIAEIVSRASGVSFAQFAQERIFEPLEMVNTHFNDNVYRVIPNRVTGYNPRDEGGFYHYNRNSPHYGGSGLYTSVEDLYKWDQNFYSGKVGGQEFIDLMLSTMKFDHDKSNDAFGLVWGDYNGKKNLWYSGGDTGFSSYYVRFPDEQLSIIFLINIGEENAGNLAQEILHILWEDNE